MRRREFITLLCCNSSAVSEILAFFDAAIDPKIQVKLGDVWNGFTAESRVGTWEEVQPWFEDQAELYFQQAAEPVFGDAAGLEVQRAAARSLSAAEVDKNCAALPPAAPR